ncbi:putative disease resistance protein RGA3 [Carex rostrata]
MSLSTIAGLAGFAVSNLVSTAGSSVVENLVSTGYSYLHSHMLADDSKAELKKLQTALPKIRVVMGIAEALKKKHPDTGQWFEQFRQAVEASEDVLDKLEYKKLKDMVKNRDEAEDTASSSKKRKLCTTNDSVERLKEAVTMLNWATDGVEDLLQLANFNSLLESRQEVGQVLKGQTTSFLAENEVFGREVEKNKIIDWLKQPTNAHLSCFSIVGVGGQGKTTLVQFAYQEMLKEKQFDKTIWVCVSTNFSVEDVTRKMLSETNCGKPLNALQKSLKDMVLSKKILLVLDDVWDDKRRCDWEQLIAPLKFVQQGSKIILTTRMKSVAELLANVINTEHKSLTLEGLGEQELRLLFYSYAFRGFNHDNHQNLQIVADQILKLLRSSPLAAKLIGSLLNSRMDHQYWRKILNHGSLFNLEQAEDVMDVLKLSYYHLPVDLQVCFRFCSIFPQDHQFNKDDLIKMWIASGFISQQSSKEKSPEDIGEDYFDLLLRKSFFEYSKLQKGERYAMHDLMHDLARNVSIGECCRIEPNDKSITIHSTVRHVSVHGREIDRVSNLGNLRSLVIITEKDSYFVLPSNLIKKPLCLLKINGYSSLELPEEMSCLVHLRYLSIETESVKYSFLASIYKLYHLQVLEFPTSCDNSSYLGIETTGMTNLLMLRYLRLPKEIMQTIHGVHKLTSLRELTFFVGQESGQHINELGKLNSIQHLSIENIDNIEDPNEAKSANLLEKTNLISLSLKWTSESNFDNPEQIINYLQPHPNLMELTVENYKGQRSSNWMKDSSSLNLSSLKFSNCPVWKNQLFSWQMPYLESIDICNCLNLDKLPNMPLSLRKFRIHNVSLTALPDFHQTSNNNSQPLSLKLSLRVVEIESCPNLMSLNGFLQQDNLDLQSIVTLTISGCEKLVLVPVDTFGKLLSLSFLSIKDCQNLTECPSLPLSLKHFEIENVGVSALPGYYQSSDSWGGPSTSSSLTYVDIRNCPKLTALNGFLQSSNINFQSFRDISIDDCMNLVDIPIGAFGNFVLLIFLSILECPMLKAVDNQSNLLPPSLKKLFIMNCGELDVPLLESASRLTALTELSIFNCVNISRIPSSENAFVSLSYWHIRGCDKLVEHSSREQALGVKQGSNLVSLKLSDLVIDHLSLLFIEPLRSLKFVSELRVSDCSSIEELPEQWLQQNNSTLKKLNIRYAKSLKSLPATMSRLTVLEELKIIEADSLELLPELPTSLRSLTILPSRSLKSLPATLARLTMLEKLHIDHADWPKHLLELPASLRILNIGNASTLKSLTALESLGIEQANLEELPELPASLREFIIKGASSLKSLPPTIARLTSLRRLEILKADLLEEIPKLPASLEWKRIKGRGGRWL